MESDRQACARHARQTRRISLRQRTNSRNIQCHANVRNTQSFLSSFNMEGVDMESDRQARARHARQTRRIVLRQRTNGRDIEGHSANGRVTHIQSHSVVHEDGTVTTSTNYPGVHMESDRQTRARHARQTRRIALRQRTNARNIQCHSANGRVTHIQSHSVVHEDGTVTTSTNYPDDNINDLIMEESEDIRCIAHDDDLMQDIGCNVDGDEPMQRKCQEKWDFGDPDRICQFCGAILWYEERSLKSRKPRNPTFSICCQQGSVQLPLLRESPTILKKLLDYQQGTREAKFRDNIRAYNCMFAFTSMGGKIDNSVNDGRSPYVFRINGQNHHRIGSLLPVDGEKPRFAQLYIYDTVNEVSNRLNAVTNDVQGRNLDAEIIKDLQQMLDEHNALAKSFRTAKDRFEQSSLESVRLRLIGARTKDARQYNVPTCSEIAALMVGDGFENDDYRDVIVDEKGVGLKRINEIHPSFMAMQYPLLFPYAEDSYRIGIPYSDIRKKGKGIRKYVTIREYYAFRIQQRFGEGETLIRAGRLYQQFLVDAYACIEENRLRYIKSIQPELRFDLYNGLRDAIVSGDTRPASVGKRVVLPSSFTGGPRYMVQNYQDAIAICRWAGAPDLFITFTCNPKWVEIQRFLNFIPGQTGKHRAEIVTRVFKIKLNQLMEDLRGGKHFGKVMAATYTIEFQKRGLPHAHILLFLHRSYKVTRTSDINKIISAELPDVSKDPLGYKIVVDFMIHGPCGPELSSPCMSKGECSKHFPKKFNNETIIDKNGFPVYRRRKDSRTAKKNGITVDNRWVAPYNRDLIVKYDAHINVEYCNQTRAVKYLFKYVNKGSDRATIVIENNTPTRDSAGTEVVREVDEIKTYLDCRYISPSEASWRILDFEIQFHKPAVERLCYHLPDEQPIIFKDTDDIRSLQKRKDLEVTKFTQWMETNALYADARKLTYAEFPTKWTWCSDQGIWKRRGRQRAHRQTKNENVQKIGRIYYAHPTSGEKFYLRMLLNIVKGPTKFADIRTVNNVVYPDFKSACLALGLLDDDYEWHQALEEASHWATSSALREMFVTLLLFCEVSNPLDLWNNHWKALSDDISRKQKYSLQAQHLELTDDQIKSFTLLEIEDIMSRNGRSLKEFTTLPFPNATFEIQVGNRLVREELSYNRDTLHREYTQMYACLNVQQKHIFDVVTEAVDKGCGGFFFVYGSGGTGKTYLWNTITAKLRSEGKIVLAVASSGIASLLLPGGKTSHSRFRIPIDPDQNSCCDIKQQTHLAELIRMTHLVIWDEAPMLHRHIFEAVDRTFRDLMGLIDGDSRNKVFGGKAMLFGGDFRQILPVVLKGTRETIVAAAINRSPIWKFCRLFTLTINMRLNSTGLDDTARQSLGEFAQWVLHLGEGKLPTTSFNQNDEANWIEIPNDLLIPVTDNPIAEIVRSTYPNLIARFGDLQYLTDRCILAPTNECVDQINSFVISSLPGELRSYFSADSISPVSDSIENQDILYPIEFLNTLEFSGVAAHKIELKVGVPIMMIRNVNPSIGLCNGTRLIVTQLAERVIEAEIVTGSNIGRSVYIPRIVMSASDTKWPFILRRRQFPIKICFAMTINKSQGQTLKNIGIFLSRPVFSHGQLYVAVSRTTSRDGLKILIVKQADEPDGYTQNIVYQEAFNDLFSVDNSSGDL